MYHPQCIPFANWGNKRLTEFHFLAAATAPRATQECIALVVDSYGDSISQSLLLHNLTAPLICTSAVLGGAIFVNSIALELRTVLYIGKFSRD